MSKYITAQKVLIRKMFQASYPKIDSYQPSVRMEIHGLDTHQAFHDVARAIRLLGIPHTLKFLGDRLLEEETVVGTKDRQVHISGQMH